MRVLPKKHSLDSEHLGGWLRGDRTYIVLAIEQHHLGVAGYRLESEQSRQPVVFKASEFEIHDNRVPKCWIIHGVHGATVELGPECFGKKGFWERYFDGDPRALEEYRRARDEVIADS